LTEFRRPTLQEASQAETLPFGFTETARIFTRASGGAGLSARLKSNVIGGWPRSLTYAFGNAAMNTSEAHAHQSKTAPKADTWVLFLVIVAVIHGAALIVCSMIRVPPRISQQLAKVTVSVCLLLLPFICSLCLLFRYRSLSERAISYGSLLISLFWIGVAVSLVSQLLKGP